MRILDLSVARGVRSRGPAPASELQQTGLATAPAKRLNVPRIAEAPACLECREHHTLFIGNARVVVGEVVHFHIRDELVEAERFHIKLEELRAVGRMGGGRYTRTRPVRLPGVIGRRLGAWAGSSPFDPCTLADGLEEAAASRSVFSTFTSSSWPEPLPWRSQATSLHPHRQGFQGSSDESGEPGASGLFHP